MSGRRALAAALAVAGLVVVVVLLTGGNSDDRRKARVAAPSSSQRAPEADRRRRREASPRPRRPLTGAQAIERVRRLTPWVTRGSARGRLVALTFDDGPGAITPALLAELRRLRAPATFFPLAGAAASSPGLARTEARAPLFAVGSHTVSHARLTTLGADAQRTEIVGGARTLRDVTGGYPRLFRPPYGEYDDATLQVLRRERALMVLWTVSSYDWRRPEADYITRRVLRLVRPGAIVLMHDAGGTTRQPTLQALPRIVRELRRRGYRLVTVPRLLRDAPPERRPPRPPSPYPG